MSSYRTLIKSKGKDSARKDDPRVLLSSPTLISRKGMWTAAEDAGLELGYQKYGMCWTAISQDPEAGLLHKTGAQVRDRFRTKFSDKYGAEARQFVDRKRSAPGNPSRSSTFTESEIADLEKGYEKHGYSWSKMLQDPELNLGHKTGSQLRDVFRIKFPALYGNSVGERSNHAPTQKRKQPPPNNTKGHRKQIITSNDYRLLGTTPSTTAGAQELEDEDVRSDDSGSESDNDNELAEADEHITPSRPSISTLGPNNIMGLLNSDAMDDRPSSALRLDGWDENVALPPLQWEDMATRPMFDLE